MKTVVVLLAVLLISVRNTESACMSPGTGNGPEPTHCEFQGHILDIDETKVIGCYRIQCQSGGTLCYTAVSPKYYQFPDHCEVVKNGCAEILVEKHDHELLCEPQEGEVIRSGQVG